MAHVDAKQAYGIAHGLAKRLERRELRALCDEKTGWELGQWHLDKLTQWVEEHPAYQALPEETEELPNSPPKRL